MRKNDRHTRLSISGLYCALLIVGIATNGSSIAATALGSASATVIESLSVVVNVTPAVTPPLVVAPVTPAVLPGTVFRVDTFSSSLSTSGPLLRVGGAPPSVGSTVTEVSTGAAAPGITNAQGQTVVPGVAGTAPAVAVNTASVSVTRNVDGSLAVSGGAGLTFAVSQPTQGSISIEYN